MPCGCGRRYDRRYSRIIHAHPGSGPERPHHPAGNDPGFPDPGSPLRYCRGSGHHHHCPLSLRPESRQGCRLHIPEKPSGHARRRCHEPHHGRLPEPGHFETPAENGCQSHGMGGRLPMRIFRCGSPYHRNHGYRRQQHHDSPVPGRRSHRHWCVSL